MKRILREPFLHFIVLGAAVFAGFAIFGRKEAPEIGDDRTIVVTRGHLEPVVSAFVRTWQRPPTERELAGLVEDHIREEVMFREAIALGLDRDDTIVRRRLRQKLEFLLDEAGAIATPRDEDLQAFLHEYAERFRQEARIAFEHVAIKRDVAVADLVARLEAGAEVGEASLLPPAMDLTPRSEIARVFGDAFARGLDTAPEGRWSGPVESAYGLHLVRVRSRTEAQLPELSEIREIVAHEWQLSKRREVSDGAYRKLRERYTIRIEESKP